MTKSNMPVTINGITLRSEGKFLVVEVDFNGKTYEVIRTFAPLDQMSVDHHVTGLGILSEIDRQ